MATAVYDDKRTYYYGAGGTSWVLPAESFAAFEANQDAAISAQTFEEDEAKEDAAAEEVAADDAANEQWVVRLHPDSGQIFYHSHVDNTSSWNNPYEEDDFNAVIRSVEDTQMDEGEVAALEDLSGFNLSLDRNVFQSEEAQLTRSRLSKWVADSNLEVTAEDGIRIKWAEYVDVMHDPQDLPLNVNVILPRNWAITGDLESIDVSLKLSDTMAFMLDMVFARFTAVTGKTIEEARDRYAFKLVGFMDYLLHSDFKLGHHDYVAAAARKHVQLKLYLVRLSDADLMDLGPVLATSLEEAREAERQKVAVDGDGWGELEPESLPMQQFIAFNEIRWPFRVLVQGVQDCPDHLPGTHLHVEVALYNNGKLLHHSNQPTVMSTVPVSFSKEPRWPAQWISFPFEVANLPHSTRIAFSLKRKSDDGVDKKLFIAGAALPLVDYRGHLVAGKREVNLWPHQDLQCARDPKLGKGENMPRNLNLATGTLAEDPMGASGVLQIEFDSYSLPVYAEQTTLNETKLLAPPAQETPPPAASEARKIEAIANTDPLTPMAQDDKFLIWRHKIFCSQDARLLPKFLQAVDWTTSQHVKEALNLACQWAVYQEGEEVNALQLLLGTYSNSVVREYAVRQIDRMHDNELQEYLLQLVQAVKYEAYHDSPLLRMLLRRALRSPNKIGHTLFWLLRSEMHNPDICERFGVALAVYLEHSGVHRVYLAREVNVNNLMEDVAEKTKLQPKDKRVQFARDSLRKLNAKFPPKFTICLSPRIEVTSIVPEKCKVMNSKKLPLWICFENADPAGDRYLVLFKAGDDLRQDLMTLQMLRVMDQIWRDQDLDLQILPYGCCATGHDLGMIEVVVNSNTTANIQVDYGGGALGAFRSTPIDRFLRKYNDTRELYEKSRETFMYTCAGYCVATYVLGIGDRHSDNIMVTESGHLFHIDFGHFLGNFKSKFGIKRERAPFVFTPEMAYVLGTDGYVKFEGICCKAYNMLRAKTSLLISLFLLMVPAGMPELLEEQDIEYLQVKLEGSLNDAEAEISFRKEIKQSLNTMSRQFDNFIHNVKAK